MNLKQKRSEIRCILCFLSLIIIGGMNMCSEANDGKIKDEFYYEKKAIKEAREHRNKTGEINNHLVNLSSPPSYWFKDYEIWTYQRGANKDPMPPPTAYIVSSNGEIYDTYQLFELIKKDGLFPSTDEEVINFTASIVYMIMGIPLVNGGKIYGSYNDYFQKDYETINEGFIRKCPKDVVDKIEDPLAKQIKYGHVVTIYYSVFERNPYAGFRGSGRLDSYYSIYKISIKILTDNLEVGEPEIIFDFDLDKYLNENPNRK